MLNRWLEKALHESGQTQAGLARELTARLGRSIDRAAVNKMVKGAREISADELLEISRITEAPIPEERSSIRVPVVGYVGAGAEVIPIDDHAQGAGLDEIDPPPGDAVAVIVRGDSMYPRYFDGERLLYVKTERQPAEMIGQECIVGLRDGRILVKVLRKGPGKTFNLESWNAPLIENQAVEWAAPVLWRGPR